LDKIQKENEALKQQLETEKREKHASLSRQEDIAENKNRIVRENERKNDSLQRVLMDLMKLNDSLKQAQKIKPEIDSDPMEEPETENMQPLLKSDYYPLNTLRVRLKLQNEAEVAQILQDFIETYLDRNSAINRLEMREYFFFEIDTLGQVVNIRDERTEFNKNSKILKPKDIELLKSMKFTPVVINGKKSNVQAALGFVANIEHTKYDYRIQKEEKIRVYKTPLYVEYVERGDRHFNLVNDTIQNYRTVTDKFNITIIDGSFKLIEFTRKEYNPFDKEKSVLLEKEVLKITKLRGIR
jgi:hypothetical protein